ncbi:hypothetical protein [Butyrivibrio sp. JL13D10]|uniref:hypothetical protein n=1 Tax=Butyrivibrio sp. JL13D10 TaxID=3236815 RepID=UPI0038B43842
MLKIGRALNVKKINYDNNIYNIAYIIIVFKAFYAYSDLIEPIRMQLVLNACSLMFALIMAYKMLFLQKYSEKKAIIFLLIGLLTLYTDRKTYMFMMLPNFFLIAATQEVDIKKTIRRMYRISTAIIGLHVIAYPVIYFFNRSSLHFAKRGVSENDKVRHQFLLSHPNIFSMLLLWTILGYIYVNYKKLDRKKIVGLWFIYVFFYMFTYSNSGLIILSAITMLLLLKKTLGNMVDGIVLFLARYLYSILGVFFIGMMVGFPKTQGISRVIWLAIDKFFTGRLKYGAYAYHVSGFTLFGKHIYFGPKELWEGFWVEGFACDNAYMWIAVSYGLFYFVLIAYLFWKYSKRAEFEEQIIFIAYALYTSMELYVTYMYFCFAVILVGKYLWEDYGKNRIVYRRKKANTMG